MTQLRVFSAMLLFGFAGGFLYEPFLFIHRARSVHLKIIAALSDAIFCALLGGLYLLLFLASDLTPFRVYHIFGIAFGLFLYEKSLHKTVAFFARKVYNVSKKFISLQKEHSACKTRDRPSLPKKQRGSP